EQRKREERERKKKEWEERKNANRPNFVITKKEPGARETEEEKKEEVTKSKEQLEAEKRAILEQRIQPLNISGFNADQLKNKAKELHDLICRLEGDIYDLSQRFTRQSYDMQELAERARQINKGGKAKAITNAPDPLAAKFSGIPPMVVMYSQYERVKDPRSFKDRRTVFTGANYAEEYQRIAPSHVLVMTEEGFQIAGAAEGGGHSAAPAPATEVPVE
ncbi:troponin T, fast skeletal muscle, partial [Schistosoma bovis]